MLRFAQTSFAALVCLFSVLLGLRSQPSVASEPAAPNIIFVLCDDLGWGDLGVLHQNKSSHSKRHRTPNIDRMAAAGMQLQRHYCPAPVCAPSRASLLTGVHQGNAVVRDNQFDKMLEDNHTLGSVLQQAGYRTAMIGKYGLQGTGNSAEDWPGYPTRRGFDEFFGYVRHVDGHVHYPADHWTLGNGEKHQTPKEVWHNNSEVSAGLSKCYTTDLFTARSKHWIETHSKTQPDQPFFLYLAYDTPHAALQVPTMQYPPGNGIRGGVQWLGEPGQMINTAAGDIDSFRHPDYVGKGWTDAEERFATMVRRIDDCMGDLLQTLRDLGIDDNTLVVISSDNGPHRESYIQNVDYAPTSFQSYGPLDGIKRDTWEGGIRVATLAWWPGHIQPESIDLRPSQFHDWLPTFADLAGKAAPARTDGVSLVPRLMGQSDALPSQIYVEYLQQGKTPPYNDFLPAHRERKRGQQQVIHVDGYKGIRLNIKSHNDPFEIYDLLVDPGEANNLAGTSPFYDALQKRMHDRVLQIRRPNNSAKRPYDENAVPAVASVDTKPGVRYRFFAGDFTYVPKTASLSPQSDGEQDSWNLKTIVASAPGAIELSGFIDVPQTGVYTFKLTGGNKSFLRVHDAPVIDADFGYEPGQAVTAKMHLAAGLHPIQLTGLCSASESLDVELSIRSDDQAPVKFCR